MNWMIITKITGVLVPFIQVYGFYILLHGHLSPGGGFAGGAILGVSIIIYLIVFNKSEEISHEFFTYLESGGTLFFIIMGFAGIILGGNFLSNATLEINMGQAGNLFSGGLIVLITVAIGLKVASTILSLFYDITEGD